MSLHLNNKLSVFVIDSLSAMRSQQTFLVSIHKSQHSHLQFVHCIRGGGGGGGLFMQKNSQLDPLSKS